MKPLLGLSFVGAGRPGGGGAPFSSIDPATGSPFGPTYHSASSHEVDQACDLAAASAAAFAASAPAARAGLLRALAERLAAAEARFCAIMPSETALPEARVKSELARTCAQARLFADLVEEGSWVDARLDSADPARQPVPKPDLRSMLQPIGPVAVITPVNFPLAFGAAGADVVSALAAGAPVVVKAHPSHPQTSELSGQCMLDALGACGLPSGTYALLFDQGHDVAQAIVRHPAIAAVAYTGSQEGGRTLMSIAATRPEPIPVFAEMGSLNPVVITSGSWSARGDALIERLAGSIIGSGGQLCTRPGLVIVEGGGADLARRLSDRLAAAPQPTLLNPLIAERYRKGISERRGVPPVPAVPPLRVAPAVLAIDAVQFMSETRWHREIFGPCATVVSAKDHAEVEALLRTLPGQLAGTLWFEPGEETVARRYLAALQKRCGRVICHGMPTGVEVCHAMVHGGPFPSSSDARTTSVGTASILRFVRPVCYQDVPDGLLPPELQDGNPYRIRRLVDGEMERADRGKPAQPAQRMTSTRS